MREKGIGNRAQEIGHREKGIGNRVKEIGNREQGIENREQGIRIQGIGKREQGISNRNYRVGNKEQRIGSRKQAFKLTLFKVYLEIVALRPYSASRIFLNIVQLLLNDIFLGIRSIRRGFKKIKKKIMENSIKGSDPNTHPP